MIPVYEPLFEGREKEYLNKCIDSKWVSSSGEFVSSLETDFSIKANAMHAIACCNGTAAIEVALWSAGVREGEVIMPVSTIISDLLAIIRVGAKPVFVDIKEDGCIDETMIEEKITQHTRAIITVNMFGNKCNVKAISSLCISHNLKLIEDKAQDWSFSQDYGNAACYSFYANKLITSGEGGMIVTDDPKLATRARQYINLCHSKVRFVHTDLGYNFRMSNLQAAVALAQLEQYDKFSRIKRENLKAYKRHIKDLLIVNNAEVPWMYAIKTDAQAVFVKEELKKAGIESRRFFFPLNRQPIKELMDTEHFPVAEDMWSHCLYLPSGLTLREWEVRQVCRTLRRTLNFTT